MSKRKTLRRISSAALLSLAMYSQTMAPGWTKEVRAFDTKPQTKIERTLEVRRKVSNVSIGRGTVKSISGSTLVITDKKGGKDFNVLVDEKTKILSKSSVKVLESDITVGHEVNVVGKVENGDQSSIRALAIRDLSLVVRNGQFKGVVQTTDGNSVSIKVGKSNNLIKVMLDGSKVTDNTNKPINPSDIKVGNTIKVKGTLNGADNTLTMVTSIKDLSLPVR